MKTKSYKHGKYTYKAYMKTVGHGYEVGIKFKGKALFVGNFIHSKEANEWWTAMNKEVTVFSKRYWVTPKALPVFYTKFLSNHLYKSYYKYVDRLLNKHVRSYTTAFNKTERRYKHLKKAWKPAEKTILKRSA